MKIYLSIKRIFVCGTVKHPHVCRKYQDPRNSQQLNKFEQLAYYIRVLNLRSLKSDVFLYIQRYLLFL